MNKWEQVANIFGLELNEEFEILDENGEKFEGKYYFSNKGIMDEHTVCYGILQGLLYDGYTIIKKLWKPKNGDTYWFWNDVMNRCESPKWRDMGIDLILWKVGNCFKTKEEAEFKGKELKKQLMKEYEES